MTAITLLCLGLLGAVESQDAPWGWQAPEEEGAPGEPAAHRPALLHLHRLHAYRPAKTSFVLGLEGLSGLAPRLQPGDRVTLVDAEGPGSLRHIWAYWGDGPAPHRLEFYIDGEAEPSLRGTLPEIMAAAARVDQGYVPGAATLVPNDSHNLYLPVPFDQSLRLDLVAEEGFGMHFLQLDYREHDPSMQGQRLVQEGEGEAMALRYTEAPPPPPEADPRGWRERAHAGRGDMTVTLDGPAILRRLAFNAVRPGVRLRVYFDGAETPAVDADLADFFGPFRGTGFNNNACYLPMPFREAARLELAGADPADEWHIETVTEAGADLGGDWGYFHAKSHAANEPTNGWAEFPILHVRGRGHWVGMHLYDSGMDHGGGDFTVVDGGSGAPAFLHGINGEDYFSFALFGQGQNFPYSEAFANDVGRTRLHLESPYPFDESLQISWGALRGLRPRAVSFWYQERPADTTTPGQAPPGLMWQVFGPVDAPLADDGFHPDVSSAEALFAPLPSVESLDAGESHTISHHFTDTFTGAFEGWAEEPAVGPLLDLTYVYRHALDIGGHSHMGYYPRLMMASTQLRSAAERDVTLQLSYDDPIEVRLNGSVIHTDLALRNGFTNVPVAARLAAGPNRLVIRMADTPNVNTCWAAVALRVLDETGRDISLELQPLE
jgi:hypothetical protein